MSSERKLLVLDLDETLVHARDQPLAHRADLRIGEYYVYRRPYLAEFVAFAVDTFRVGIWTSSGALYAEPLVAQIFPEGSLEFVWSAARCTPTRNWESSEAVMLKCLRKLKDYGYSMESIIAVDDTPAKHARNYGNLVQVREYLGGTDDDELHRLQAYLAWLVSVPNVRAIEKRGWRHNPLPQLDRTGA